MLVCNVINPSKQISSDRNKNMLFWHIDIKREGKVTQKNKFVFLFLVWKLIFDILLVVQLE